MARDSPRSLLHGAACDVSLNAIDSYDEGIQSRYLQYCSFIPGPPASRITAMSAPASTRSGSSKGHSQCHGLCCISSPVSAPSTHRVPPQPRCSMSRYRYRYRHHPQHACKCVADLPALNGRAQPSHQPITPRHPAPSPSVPAVGREHRWIVIER